MMDVKSLIRYSSYFCLVLLGTACGLYLMFGACFAEMGLRLSWFDFPVFIGEMLMMFSFLVLLTHLFLEQTSWRGWRVCVLAYFAWVMYQMAIGYYQGGAYALRNAALFYYPIFAVMTRHFAGKVNLGFDVRFVFPVLICCAAMAMLSSNLVLFLLALCLLAVIRNKGWRWLAGLFLLGCFLSRFAYLSGGRGALVSFSASLIFLLWFAGRIMRLPLARMMAVFALVLSLFTGYLWFFGDRNALISLVSPANMISRFEYYNDKVRQGQPGFVPQVIKAQPYHKDGVTMEQTFKGMMASQQDSASSGQGSLPAAVWQAQAGPEKPVGSTAAGTDRFRNLETAYSNGVFRLFVWRDMLRELRQDKAWMGVGFARPQRSVSIEILDWAHGEWSRDGWIMPHNSFLHLIYRGGLVGAALIVFVVALLVVMTRDFLRASSWLGGVLVSALIYWIVTAQFGVVLELPYNAVPFWALFGLVWAYWRVVRKNHHQKEQR